MTEVVHFESVRKISVMVDVPEEVPPFDRKNMVQIAEGKTKKIYEGIPGCPYLVLVENKDRITAFNAERVHDLEGKAELSNATNCKVFDFLRQIGIRTHFVKQESATEFIAERCAMIPLEWIVRRVATGSFLKRNEKVNEGYRFYPPKMEITYKDDKLGDPIWSEENVIESGLVCAGVEIGREEVNLMSRVSVTVFEVLEKTWARLGCTLVDMKVEFGVNAKGEIVLADVIDSDSWRLWPNGDKRLQVDKQFYRDLPEVTAEDLKQLKQNFKWVIDQMDQFVTAPRGRAVVLMGSATDWQWGMKIQNACLELGIPCEIRVASAHKGTPATMEVIAEYESDGIPTVFIAVAGKSNGLGPVTSGNTCYPVINCPPIGADKEDVWSSLRLPYGLGCSTVLSPDAAALAAGGSLSLVDHMVWCRLRVRLLLNYITLMKADRKVRDQNEAMLKRFRGEEKRENGMETTAPMTNGR